MQFEISREALIKPLQLVTGVVERRQTLPVLSNVLLALDKGALALTGTDLEVELIGKVAVDNGQGDGEITVPARKLMDIWRRARADKRGKGRVRHLGDFDEDESDDPDDEDDEDGDEEDDETDEDEEEDEETTEQAEDDEDHGPTLVGAAPDVNVSFLARCARYVDIEPSHRPRPNTRPALALRYSRTAMPAMATWASCAEVTPLTPTAPTT